MLAPVTRGNLTLFPVVGGSGADTSHLLTLDEGLRAGTVVVTEAGSVQGLIRGGSPSTARSGAEVNRLVLVNNSDRPLLLLAGEVVTGGKQDRVIGADRIVPAQSGPIDLSVFCVEPGRWVESSAQFGSMKSQMAQPSVRMPAMAERNQQQVWDRVASASSGMRAAVPQAAPAVAGTTSYAKVMQNPEVEKKVAAVLPTMTGCCTNCARRMRAVLATGRHSRRPREATFFSTSGFCMALAYEVVPARREPACGTGALMPPDSRGHHVPHLLLIALRPWPACARWAAPSATSCCRMLAAGNPAPRLNAEDRQIDGLGLAAAPGDRRQ